VFFKSLSTQRREPSKSATCSRQKTRWIPPSPSAIPVCWRRSVGRSFEASVVERLVHALGYASDDPDDQESAVMYGIATRLSFAAPAYLSGASSL
jgi:hypothetical protein